MGRKKKNEGKQYEILKEWVGRMGRTSKFSSDFTI